MPPRGKRHAAADVNLPANLSANLAVLDSVDPLLAQRIRWPVDGAHVHLAADGTATYQLNDRKLPLSLAASELALPPKLAPDGAIFLFGVGLGEQLAALLETFPDSRILAWERDPFLLRQTLSRHRLAEALRSGQLRLRMGVDLIDLLRLAPGTEVVVHPLLGRFYREELHLLRHGAGRPRAIVCSGGLFVDDLTDELRRRGFSVLPLQLTRLSREELVRSLRQVAPELVAAINYTDQLAELCEEAGCPLLCWEIDPFLRTLRPAACSTERTFVFTYRRSHVAEFRAAGFRHVEHLPLATNPEHRKPTPLSPVERERFGAPVSFVGSSMVNEAAGFEDRFLQSYCAYRGSEAAPEGRALLVAVLAAQRQDFGRDLILEQLRARCPDWPELAQAARFASEIASAEKRVMTVSSLSRFGVRVWGDAGWQVTEGAKVKYQGLATHRADLTRIYCGSRINLDIGRLYQLDIVTMRIFDILACGGFVLAERSDDLAALFEIDREIACYSSLAELSEKVAFYLGHEAEAHAIARAGQQAVLTRHTIGQRVEHMLRLAGMATAAPEAQGRSAKP